MNETRDKNLPKEFFNITAEVVKKAVNLDFTQDIDHAAEFIGSYDNWIDKINTNLPNISPEDLEVEILRMGSALGVAFRVIFGGDWHFSEAQQRWVIRTQFGKDEIELNVFNKIEKRMKNGMEDSINYYASQIVNIKNNSAS